MFTSKIFDVYEKKERGRCGFKMMVDKLLVYCRALCCGSDRGTAVDLKTEFLFLTTCKNLNNNME